MLLASRFARSSGLMACGLAAALPIAASAQNCKLSVQASPNVIASGQISSIDVRASFPSSAFAFASAQFDVESTDPMWMFASAGAIVGSDVLGINVAQPHAPQVGVLADPSNPLRVWTGEIMPTVAGPALVEGHADPSSFWYYPSKLTPSSVAGVPVGGSDFIFVEPLSVNGWAAAPGSNTTIHISDDVVVDGTIITGENPEPLVVGLLLPAVQKVRDAAVRLGLTTPPESLTTRVRAAQRSRVPSMMVTFDSQATFSRNDRSEYYTFSADLAGEGPAIIGAYLRGVRVAVGDLNKPADRFMVNAVPSASIAKVGTGSLVLPAANTSTSMFTWTFRFEKPVTIKYFNGRLLTADTITLSRRLATDASGSLSDVNLNWQTFSVKGAQSLTLKPGRM